MCLRTSDYPTTTAYTKDHLVHFTIQLQWIWLELLKKRLLVNVFFFFEREAKALPHPLIKQKVHSF
jgi:hypothetical protein